MPATKRKTTHDPTDNFTTAQSSSQPTKRTRPLTSNPTSTSSSKLPAKEIDSDGNPYWQLSTARRVTISDFKGKKMVSVREYYQKDGTWLPGKKGITMTLEQFGELVKVLPQIEGVLAVDGVGVERPVYDDDNDHGDSVGMKEEFDEDDDRDLDGESGRRANIEATSDEDEDD